jgi:hypothetical protein
LKHRGKLPISASEKPQFCHFPAALHLSNNGVFRPKIIDFATNQFGLVEKIAKPRSRNRKFRNFSILHRPVEESAFRKPVAGSVCFVTYYVLVTILLNCCGVQEVFGLSGEN